MIARVRSILGQEQEFSEVHREKQRILGCIEFTLKIEQNIAFETQFTCHSVQFTALPIDNRSRSSSERASEGEKTGDVLHILLILSSINLVLQARLVVL